MGDVLLTTVRVTDSQGVEVNYPQDTLDAGESMICTAGVLPWLASMRTLAWLLAHLWKVMMFQIVIPAIISV